MSSGGGSKSKEKSKSKVTVPDYLKPLLNQQIGGVQSTIGSLQGMLGGATADDLVAGFDPLQLIAQGITAQDVLGEGGSFDLARGVFGDLAGGQDAAGSDILRSIAGETSIPGLDQLTQFAGGAGYDDFGGRDFLSGLLGGSGLDETAQDALRRTAGGEFLYGGEGFDQAVQAAVRAAQPGVISRFGSLGAGGGTSALANTAIGRAATDAFASQYGDERARQLSAAGALNEGSLADRAQRGGFADVLANLGINLRGQNIGAAGTAGNLGLGFGQLRAGAAESLGQLDLARGDQRARAAQAGTGLTESGAGLLGAFGQQRQDLAQRRLDAPVEARLKLLQGLLAGGLDFNNLLGKKGSNKKTGIEFGYGE
jgi:hypothetical protein